jgi:hypothetical protein
VHRAIGVAVADMRVRPQARSHHPKVKGCPLFRFAGCSVQARSAIPNQPSSKAISSGGSGNAAQHNGKALILRPLPRGHRVRQAFIAASAAMKSSITAGAAVVTCLRVTPASGWSGRSNGQEYRSAHPPTLEHLACSFTLPVIERELGAARLLAFIRAGLPGPHRAASRPVKLSRTGTPKSPPRLRVPFLSEGEPHVCCPSDK